MPKVKFFRDGFDDSTGTRRFIYAVAFEGDGVPPGAVVSRYTTPVDPSQGTTQQEKDGLIAAAIDAAWEDAANEGEDRSDQEGRRGAARGARPRVTEIVSDTGRIVRGGAIEPPKPPRPPRPKPPKPPKPDPGDTKPPRRRRGEG